MNRYDYDVVIIGSGPSGIAAATGLIRAGITNIVVFEREAEVGGIPRHTHHPSFGMLVFKRPTTGPAFIEKIRKRCPDLRFETRTTVAAIRPGGEMEIISPSGSRIVRARHIILATGARETPRHGRLVTGLRPQGVMTTGALQQFVYTGKMKPFTRAVIVGTELASFSALWTLRHAGIKPVAMIEENRRITAYRPATIFARLMRVPIHYRSKITDIAGVDRLSQVEIEDATGNRRKIACDGVIFSGRFTGDNNLARASHLTLNPDTGIPLIDQNWQSSDPDISVIGNTAHPADMGDQCYLEGLTAGKAVANTLNGNAPSGAGVPVKHGPDIKMTTPNMLRPNGDGTVTFDINLHVTREYTGPITVEYRDETLYQKSRHCLPARRITLKNIRLQCVPGDRQQPIQVILG